MSSKKWLVQARKGRGHKWVNKGWFGTRAEARAEQYRLQATGYWDGGYVQMLSYGFANTRAVQFKEAEKS